MKQDMLEQQIDVRPMPPKQRHPTIFNTWASLDAGGSILLTNDHDPLPLYYQFACENAGGFRWEYLQQGPEVWQVRISKGNFPEPGFVPEKKPARPAAVSMEFVKPLLLDVRPIFASGGTPCEAIDAAVAQVLPGQPLVLLVPFEPVPLYAKLENQGFTRQAQKLDDGTWRIEFRRDSSAPASGPRT